MDKEMGEDLKKIFDKLNRLEEGQLKLNQQVESLTSNVESSGFIQTNSEILKR